MQNIMHKFTNLFVKFEVEIEKIFKFISFPNNFYIMVQKNFPLEIPSLFMLSSL